ncbi:hypothetical protein EJD97_018754, partial [Solanum chilense]
MTLKEKNYIESFFMEIVTVIVERVASYSLKDLMRVKLSDSNRLEMLKRAADGGHLCAGYVHAIILIFKGGESMKEDTSFIGNMSIPSL